MKLWWVVLYAGSGQKERAFAYVVRAATGFDATERAIEDFVGHHPDARPSVRYAHEWVGDVIPVGRH